MPAADRDAFTDASVARPWLTAVWFRPLFRAVPPWLAADTITLGSTGAVVLAVLAIATVPGLGPAAAALLLLGAVQVYVAGDHLDGLQAVATGTAGPRGEFLDHHCDLWAGCWLVYGYCLLIAAPPAVLFVMTWLMIAGFALTYYERYDRRALHFTAVGTLEAIVGCTAFLLSWLVPAARAWWQGPLGDTGWPRHALVTGLGVTMATGVLVAIALRLRRLPRAWVRGMTPITLVALVGALRAGPHGPWTWLLLTTVGADYVAAVMAARRGSAPPPQALRAPAVAVAAALGWPIAAPWLLGVALAWSGARYAARVAGVVRALGAAATATPAAAAANTPR
jgi:phosphatidylglycerophosphate synthase